MSRKARECSEEKKSIKKETTKAKETSKELAIDKTANKKTTKAVKAKDNNLDIYFEAYGVKINSDILEKNIANYFSNNKVKCKSIEAYANLYEQKIYCIVDKNLSTENTICSDISYDITKKGAKTILSKIKNIVIEAENNQYVINEVKDKINSVLVNDNVKFNDAKVYLNLHEDKAYCVVDENNNNVLAYSIK